MKTWITRKFPLKPNTVQQETIDFLKKSFKTRAFVTKRNLVLKLRIVQAEK